MADFAYFPMFDAPHEDTPWRKLDGDYVAVDTFRGEEVVVVKQDALADLTGMDLSTNVLGQDIDWPVFCSPTAMTRLFHHEGELAVARAAHEHGTMYSLSSLSTTSISWGKTR